MLLLLLLLLDVVGSGDVGGEEVAEAGPRQRVAVVLLFGQRRSKVAARQAHQVLADVLAPSVVEPVLHAAKHKEETHMFHFISHLDAYSSLSKVAKSNFSWKLDSATPTTHQLISLRWAGLGNYKLEPL